MNGSPAVGNTKRATLLSCLDWTVTAGGGRLMKERLSAPLTDIPTINQRLDCVELFHQNQHLAQQLHTQLRGCGDAERIVQKVRQLRIHVYVHVIDPTIML